MPTPRQDPKRGGRRPPRNGKDVADRGAAVRVGRDQPSRQRGRAQHRLGPRRRREATRPLDLGGADARGVERAQAQSDRHARRSQLPGRRARRYGWSRERSSSSRACSASRSRPRACGAAARSSASRAILVNLLDRERADFYGALDALAIASPSLVAISSRSGRSTGSAASSTCCTWWPTAREDAAGHDESVPIPDDLKALADEWRDKLMDVVAEASDDLMERYLEGGGSPTTSWSSRSRISSPRALFPVGLRCRHAQRRRPRPARPDRRRSAVAGPGTQRPRECRRRHPRRTASRRSPTRTSARSACCASSRAASGGHAARQRAHPHQGAASASLSFQGKDHTAVTELGPGTSAPSPKLKDVHGRRAGRRRRRPRDRSAAAARAGRLGRGRAEDEGRRGEDAGVAARLAEEDPTLASTATSRRAS